MGPDCCEIVVIGGRLGEDLMELHSSCFDVGYVRDGFPDVTFTGADGGKVHLEIFHRWHAGQLANRLKVLATTSKQPLVIGVAQDVANGKDTAPILEESAWFSVHGFIFKNLPTPKSVQQVLVRHAAASAG